MRIRFRDFDVRNVIFFFTSGIVGFLVFLYVLYDIGMIGWYAKNLSVLRHPENYVHQVDDAHSRKEPEIKIYFTVSDDPLENKGAGIDFQSIDLRTLREAVPKDGEAVIPTGGRRYVFLYLCGQNFTNPISDKEISAVIEGPNGAQIRWGARKT
jgi:hypothetical protein